MSVTNNITKLEDALREANLILSAAEARSLDALKALKAAEAHYDYLSDREGRIYNMVKEREGYLAEAREMLANGITDDNPIATV
jgi:uncharacterized protein YdcH (DUF465 family)